MDKEAVVKEEAKEKDAAPEGTTPYTSEISGITASLATTTGFVPAPAISSAATGAHSKDLRGFDFRPFRHRLSGVYGIPLSRGLKL